MCESGVHLLVHEYFLDSIFRPSFPLSPIILFLNNYTITSNGISYSIIVYKVKRPPHLKLSFVLISLNFEYFIFFFLTSNFDPIVHFWIFLFKFLFLYIVKLTLLFLFLNEYKYRKISDRGRFSLLCLSLKIFYICK